MIPLLTAIMPIVGEVVDRLVPDQHAAKKVRMELEQKMIETANEINIAQAEINKESAKHKSIFVAGARPFLLWVCGFGFLYTFLLFPFLTWICIMMDLPAPPELQTTDVLMELTLAMLGLAGLRSWEKINGVSRNNLKEDAPKWFPKQRPGE